MIHYSVNILCCFWHPFVVLLTIVRSNPLSSHKTYIQPSSRAVAEQHMSYVNTSGTFTENICENTYAVKDNEQRSD
jgi:hypothetical protein